MHKLKLILFLSFQLLIISFTYGQTEITKKGYEEAVNFANCKYVAYSITDAKEKQYFIEDCDCDNNPTAQSIQNAINETKTKTIAFSKEFNKLKGMDIDLPQKKIALFLTDFIFSESLSSKYPKIYNYGKSRKGNQKFISFKNDLYKSLLKILDNYTIAVPILAKEEKVVAKSKNNTLLGNEISKISEYNQEKSNGDNTILSQIKVLSIIISVLLSLFIMSYLYYKYVRNFVSNSVKSYVSKKVSRLDLGFDQRFNRNQHEINRLKAEITELKVFVQKIKYPDKMYDENEFNNDLGAENKKTAATD